MDLGRNLGLKVVAEGVETQTAYDELARLGCDYAQGHMLSRPVPPVELIARVSELERIRQRGVELTAATGPRPLRAVPESA